MSGFLVGELNYTDPEYIANQYVTSARSGYPVSNAYNIDSRRRVWRSDGYFNVVAANNKIVFRETLLVDLEAEIPVDEYAGDAAFFAAVKAALELVGDSTYTVDRDITTNKIQITSNGGGGGGVFQLIWTDPDSSGMAALMGYSTAANQTGGLSYDADLLRIHSKERLVWDFGFPTQPTILAAVAARNIPLNISPAATVTLKAAYTNAWNTPAESFTVTYRENGLIYVNQDGIAQLDTSGYRYWALEITDVDNPDGFIELGAVSLMSHTTITRGCPAFPLDNQYQDLSSVIYSEGGQTIVGKRSQTQRFGLTWEVLDVASFERLESVFEKFGTHSSFFLVMDANDAFSTDGETYCRLVKFVDEPSARLVSAQNWSMRWNLREEL